MEPLLDKRQLAELLNVSVSWVEKETAARRLPITWVGRQIRYDIDDIRAWLDSNKEMPGADLAPVLGLFGSKQPKPTPPPRPIKPPAAPSKPRPPSGPRRVNGERIAAT